MHFMDTPARQVPYCVSECVSLQTQCYQLSLIQNLYLCISHSKIQQPSPEIVSSFIFNF